MYARSTTSFLTWAHEEGLTPEWLRIRLLPDAPKPLLAIADAEIPRLVQFHPRRRLQTPTWTLVLLLLDTGSGLTAGSGNPLGCRCDFRPNNTRSDDTPNAPGHLFLCPIWPGIIAPCRHATNSIN